LAATPLTAAPPTSARTQRDYSAGQGTNGRFNYVCAFDGLALGTEYHYRVRGNGAVIAEGYFTTRQPRGRRIRFASFGDNAYGSPSEHAIAFHAYQAHPDFIMNTGDNVYENGLDDEYRRYFFPVYNADTASLTTGAPLLRSVPFLTVMANHDINGTEPATGFHCANFDASPDALAYYTNFHLPLNGPAAPASPTYVHGAPARLADFKACAGDRFPRMANYAFDCGDAHFLCLDSNLYLDPTNAALQAGSPPTLPPPTRAGRLSSTIIPPSMSARTITRTSRCAPSPRCWKRAGWIWC
jgi:hypothetical protein